MLYSTQSMLATISSHAQDPPAPVTKLAKQLHLWKSNQSLNIYIYFGAQINIQDNELNNSIIILW